jgi:hypothetical protein
MQSATQFQPSSLHTTLQVQSNGQLHIGGLAPQGPASIGGGQSAGHAPHCHLPFSHVAPVAPKHGQSQVGLGSVH